MQSLDNGSFSDLNTIIINLTCLRENIREIKRFIGNSVDILPVVKSDAYGHGIVEVSKVIEEEGAWGLAVFDIREAIKLRENGVKLKIFLLSGIHPFNSISLREIPKDLVFGVTNLNCLETLNHLAKKFNKRFEAHIKVDIGMSRFGFNLQECKEIILNRNRWDGIFFTGIYSHLPCADCDMATTSKQIENFDSLIRELELSGWKPDVVHLANSAGFINFKMAHYNLIRPGISIYGIYPSNDMRDKLRLKPLMTFKSRLIEIKKIKKGASVSYGGKYKAQGDMKIGIIPVGYDDGYLRSLSNNEVMNTQVIIGGKRCKVLGRICMKATIIDIDSVRDAKIGDEVILIGSHGDERITVEELAEKANTISYELLCLIGTRNKRVFI